MAQRFSIKSDLFDYDILVSECEDENQFAEGIEKTYLTADEKLWLIQNSRGGTGNLARTMRPPTSKCVILRFFKPIREMHDRGVLAHEAVHCAEFVLGDFLHVPHNDDTSEVYAHYIEWAVREILKQAE